MLDDFTKLRLNLGFKNKITHTGQKKNGTKVVMIYKYHFKISYIVAATSFYIFLICWIFQNLSEKKKKGVSFHCGKEYGEPFFQFWFKYVHSFAYIIPSMYIHLQSLRSVKTGAKYFCSVEKILNCFECSNFSCCVQCRCLFIFIYLFLWLYSSCICGKLCPCSSSPTSL